MHKGERMPSETVDVRPDTMGSADGTPAEAAPLSLPSGNNIVGNVRFSRRTLLVSFVVFNIAFWCLVGSLLLS